MSERIWFVRLVKVEGPYTIEELRTNKRITLETLAWREGFSGWKAIRFIPELMWDLWGLEADLEEDEEKELNFPSQEELVLDMKQDPRFLLILLLVLLSLSLISVIYLWNE